MKSINVSTGVFAGIWARRAPGEETEDQILMRILDVGTTKASRLKADPARSDRVLWREDVRHSLGELGGIAHLSKIYRQVRNRRLAQSRSVPRSIDAIIRRELEYCSSDSESYQGSHDWFRSVDGLGQGIWALR